ncbi:MAG TPA: ThiF family adenylyltransferase [Bryobacteraceae bacterium]|nr:ThiF family adenylyltransferase [Bryobacteraceae bacterium]
MMSPEERDRYSRQIRFGGIAEEGQERLLAATAAVVGCGALGSFHTGALARAGVGHLILIDRDFVETSNLQRQWLYTEQDARDAVPKAAAAAHAIAQINSGIHVTAAVADLTTANIADLLGSAAVVLDGTDNFDTRYLVNDFCVREEIPWIYGAAIGSYGLSMPVIPGRTSCLKCVFPEPPGGVQPTCETAGVVNALTSAIASIQVADALKLLCGQEVKPRITTLDVWSGDIRQISQPAPEPACPACGRRDFVHLQESSRAPFGLCGRNAVQVHEREQAIDLQELAATLAPLGDVRAGEFALRFAIPPYELTVFPDGRAIVKGTSDIGLARSLYARYVGA